MLSLGDGEPGLRALHRFESTQFPFPIINNKMNLVEKSRSNQFPFSIFFHCMFLRPLKIWKQIRCGPSVRSIIWILCMTCGPWDRWFCKEAHTSVVQFAQDPIRTVSAQSGKWPRFFSIPFFFSPPSHWHVGPQEWARGQAHKLPCRRGPRASAQATAPPPSRVHRQAHGPPCHRRMRVSEAPPRCRAELLAAGGRPRRTMVRPAPRQAMGRLPPPCAPLLATGERTSNKE
jgi:hypothetical protein